MFSELGALASLPNLPADARDQPHPTLSEGSPARACGEGLGSAFLPPHRQRGHLRRREGRRGNGRLSRVAPSVAVAAAWLQEEACADLSC